MARALLACAILLAASPLAAAQPPIHHVFVIVLENKGFDEAFGAASPALYLARTLTMQGQLLRQYYGIGHASLPNYIAMVSGQPPNPETQADCFVYGPGCVYPSTVKTIADQLAERGLTWKGYMQDMTIPCRHPLLGAPDATIHARPGDQYATRHNPFVYFHSLLDSGECLAHDVDLAELETDLASGATTPSFALIVPNLCEDGHDAPCVDGRPGGLVSADRFLQTWVPRILGSPAWGEGSLLVITFDEADGGDATGGGGHVGAVLLSPFIRPGSINDTPYNHYALLRSVEDLFALPHLGLAGQDGLKAFGSDVYNAFAPKRRIAAHARISSRAFPGSPASPDVLPPRDTDLDQP